MPDALLVTPVMPASGGNGIAMRSGLYLEGLSRAFRVHCLVIPVFGGPGPADDLVSRLADSLSVLPLDHETDPRTDLHARLADRGARARATALHPRPALCRPATLAAAEAVAEAAAGVDLVHVYRLYLAPFLDVLLDRAERPVLTVDVDDLEDRLSRDMGHPDEAEAYARLASHYLPSVDHVVTTSAADAATVTGTYAVRNVTAVANAVRLPPPPARAEPHPTHDLVFVGTLSYQPNAEGARWLCEEVLPLLPRATVALVGSNPPEAVLALAGDPRVTVAGTVADVAPWYQRSRVAVAPLHAGGGSRIKVLEALAHRRPVVATPIGAQGLELAPGRDGLLVAGNPHGFAEACARLLDDPQRAQRLASAGRKAVEETASVEVVGERIARLFRSVVAERRVPPSPGRAAGLASQLRRNRLAADLCDQLAEAGVRAILLKGASFGTWLYGSAVDRPSGDIDLLIDPADELVASDVLRRLGFTSALGTSRAMQLGRPAADWTRGEDLVDLHRGRFWGIGVPAGQAWSLLRRRTEVMPIGGHEVTVLDTVARTMHVAIHAFASGPHAHRQAEDLRRAIEHVPFDVWTEAAALARTLEAEPCFAAGLQMTPPGRALAAELHVDVQATVESSLFAEGFMPLADGLTRLRGLPGTWPKVAAVSRALVPTPSYLAIRLPWARRSRFHTAVAYPAWLSILARRAGPALVAVRRASRVAARPGGTSATR
ncbi:MAG: glycosyltransferase [Actinomycetota bacterium]|nr:glycosyltransferase [Actinomycetota bacterium]